MTCHYLWPWVIAKRILRELLKSCIKESVNLGAFQAAGLEQKS